MTVTFVIPTIPPRAKLLERAIRSIRAQTMPVDDIIIAIDHHHEGAAATRNRGLRMAVAQPGWVGFLDDDDELLPDHVEKLVTAAEAANVGTAWGWYEVVGGRDPLPPEFRGRPYDPNAAHCVPITYMAKAHLLRSALDAFGGFVEAQAHTGYWSQDEYVLSHCVRYGGHVALADTTWHWGHHGSNTSGRPDRW